MNYVYGMRNRPAMYGTCPEGRIAVDDNDKRANYGTVTYDRPLSPTEIYKFEMIPLEPAPVLPLYKEGTEVIDLRNKKHYFVEDFDGSSWIGDRRMERIEDWLFYDPVVTVQYIPLPSLEPKEAPTIEHVRPPFEYTKPIVIDEISFTERGVEFGGLILDPDLISYVGEQPKVTFYHGDFSPFADPAVTKDLEEVSGVKFGSDSAMVLSMDDFDYYLNDNGMPVYYKDEE